MTAETRLTLLLLLLTIQTPTVIVGKTSEYARAQEACANLAPGLERMSLGVDITKLDLFHDYTVDADDGFMDKVIQYTCTEGKTWRSPYDHETYQIPDQIDDFSALSAGMVISEALVYSQKDEMKKEMAAEVGLDLDVAQFSFSTSLTYKTSFQNLQTLDKAAGSNKAHVTVARATFAPARFLGNSSISKYLVFEIEDLPAVFNRSTQNAYFQLIRSYGTHFFHKSNFGGSLSIWFAISKSLTREMSTSELNVQVQASFYSILKAHGAYSGDVANVTERFASNSSHTERYFGGQANLFDSDGYKAWWSTIAGNPWLHSGSLVPITDLLGDSNPRKTELLNAIEAYKLEAGLNETRTLIRLYQTFHEKYAGDTILEQALSRLNYENITSEGVSAVDREVQDYTITPIWFGSLFKLCTFDSFQAAYCTPVGQVPDKVPADTSSQTFAALDLRSEDTLPFKLFRIVDTNTTFFMNETIYPQVRVINLGYSARVDSAPAWIKNTQLGLRQDFEDGSTKWYQVSPSKYDPPIIFDDIALQPGETLAAFLVPAPL